MKPFTVGVADLLRHPRSRRHERVAGRVGELAITGARVSREADVALDVLLESVPEGIVVSGAATAEWQGECRRCLGPVAGALHGDFRELFERHPTVGDTYELRHDQVDLEPLARDVLLLELPLAPLCTEGCRGICPTCGADLNQGACSCPSADRDPRWAALDELREDATGP